MREWKPVRAEYGPERFPDRIAVWLEREPVGDLTFTDDDASGTWATITPGILGGAIADEKGLRFVTAEFAFREHGTSLLLHLEELLPVLEAGGVLAELEEAGKLESVKPVLLRRYWSDSSAIIILPTVMHESDPYGTGVLFIRKGAGAPDFARHQEGLIEETIPIPADDEVRPLLLYLVKHVLGYADTIEIDLPKCRELRDEFLREWAATL